MRIQGMQMVQDLNLAVGVTEFQWHCSSHITASPRLFDQLFDSFDSVGRFGDKTTGFRVEEHTIDFSASANGESQEGCAFHMQSSRAATLPPQNLE